MVVPTPLNTSTTTYTSIAIVLTEPHTAVSIHFKILNKMCEGGVGVCQQLEWRFGGRGGGMGEVFPILNSIL